MFLFAHLGFTLGVAAAGDMLAAQFTRRNSLQASLTPGKEPQITNGGWRRSDWVRDIFDLRFWALGSLLPDIIDKPLGRFLFQETFHYNGRIFSHSLLLVILILAAAFFAPPKKLRMWLMALAGGVLMHLLLDSMWLTPQTLFWPMLGWGFPWSSEGDWLGMMLKELRHDPVVYIPELIGIAVLGILMLVLVRKKRIAAFLRSGRVS
jgi:inner membrane protein